VSRARSAASVIALFALTLSACGRSSERTDRPPAASATPSEAREAGPGVASPSLDGSAPLRDPGAPLVDAGVDAAAGAPNDDDAYLEGTPRTARSIGHTSVVFKVELSTGKKAVWKPASRRGPVRYKGEIAARRLAVALGLPNVPRVFFRVLDAKAAASAAGAGPAPTGELFTKEAIVTGGVIKGALMPWIDGLAFLALESEPLASEWKRWLRDGEPIPEDKRELARQVSTLVAFDFVTGNWDRWSGGNVGIDKASGTLLYIDNDGAFFDTPPAEGLARNKRLLDGVARFSRSFVARLRELDDAALTGALGEESPAVPLLSAKALAGVLERRRQLLALIDGKRGDAGAAGDARLFAFP
jgi:hypothetical protein